STLNNVAQAGEEKQVHVRLANGLAAIEKDDQIDTITIAGMGGRLIADILAADLDKLSNIKRLVLQPNNREDELRDWLSDHGF
ncbi:tRNA (adenine(22)-N(1))-methyltransferase TrmK, partial [Streptococcus pyogenes]